MAIAALLIAFGFTAVFVGADTADSAFVFGAVALFFTADSVAADAVSAGTLLAGGRVFFASVADVSDDLAEAFDGVADVAVLRSDFDSAGDAFAAADFVGVLAVEVTFDEAAFDASAFGVAVFAAVAPDVAVFDGTAFDAAVFDAPVFEDATPAPAADGLAAWELAGFLAVMALSPFAGLTRAGSRSDVFAGRDAFAAVDFEAASDVFLVRFTMAFAEVGFTAVVLAFVPVAEAFGIRDTSLADERADTLDDGCAQRPDEHRSGGHCSRESSQ